MARTRRTQAHERYRHQAGQPTPAYSPTHQRTAREPPNANRNHHTHVEDHQNGRSPRIVGRTPHVCAEHGSSSGHIHGAPSSLCTHNTRTRTVLRTALRDGGAPHACTCCRYVLRIGRAAVTYTARRVPTHHTYVQRIGRAADTHVRCSASVVQWSHTRRTARQKLAALIKGGLVGGLDGGLIGGLDGGRFAFCVPGVPATVRAGKCLHESSVPHPLWQPRNQHARRCSASAVAGGFVFCCGGRHARAGQEVQGGACAHASLPVRRAPLPLPIHATVCNASSKSDAPVVTAFGLTRATLCNGNGIAVTRRSLAGRIKAFRLQRTASATTELGVYIP